MMNARGDAMSKFLSFVDRLEALKAHYRIERVRPEYVLVEVVTARLSLGGGIRCGWRSRG